MRFDAELSGGGEKYRGMGLAELLIDGRADDPKSAAETQLVHDRFDEYFVFCASPFSPHALFFYRKAIVSVAIMIKLNIANRP